MQTATKSTFDDMKTKTSLVIDREQLDQAAAVLGTAGVKDTIDAALADVVRRARVERLISSLREGKFKLTEEMRKEMWGNGYFQSDSD